jgi:hypothetical protein
MAAVSKLFASFMEILPGSPVWVVSVRTDGNGVLDR